MAGGYRPPPEHPSPFYQPPAHGQHVTTLWAHCGVDNAAGRAITFYLTLVWVGLLVVLLWAWARRRTRQFDG